MSWYVVYTKPRNEKKVAQLLTNKGVEVYCPIKEEIRQWSDRKKKVFEPVFKSYVFVRLDDYKQDSIPVLMTAGVVKFLWWNGKPGRVRKDEIKAIQDFLENYRNAEINIQLGIGERVMIKEGPLRDTPGVVLSVKKNMATLHLKSLGLNLVATIPLQSLQKDQNP